MSSNDEQRTAKQAEDLELDPEQSENVEGGATMIDVPQPQMPGTGKPKIEVESFSFGSKKR